MMATESLKKFEMHQHELVLQETLDVVKQKALEYYSKINKSDEIFINIQQNAIRCAVFGGLDDAYEKEEVVVFGKQADFINTPDNKDLVDYELKKKYIHADRFLEDPTSENFRKVDSDLGYKYFFDYLFNNNIVIKPDFLPKINIILNETQLEPSSPDNGTFSQGRWFLNSLEQWNNFRNSFVLDEKAIKIQDEPLKSMYRVMSFQRFSPDKYIRFITGNLARDLSKEKSISLLDMFETLKTGNETNDIILRKFSEDFCLRNYNSRELIEYMSKKYGKMRDFENTFKFIESDSLENSEILLSRARLFKPITQDDYELTLRELYLTKQRAEIILNNIERERHIKKLTTNLHQLLILALQPARRSAKNKILLPAQESMRGRDHEDALNMQLEDEFAPEISRESAKLSIQEFAKRKDPIERAVFKNILNNLRNNIPGLANFLPNVEIKSTPPPPMGTTDIAPDQINFYFLPTKGTYSCQSGKEIKLNMSYNNDNSPNPIDKNRRGFIQILKEELARRKMPKFNKENNELDLFYKIAEKLDDFQSFLNIMNGLGYEGLITNPQKYFLSDKYKSQKQSFENTGTIVRKKLIEFMNSNEYKELSEDMTFIEFKNALELAVPQSFDFKSNNKSISQETQLFFQELSINPQYKNFLSNFLSERNENKQEFYKNISEFSKKLSVQRIIQPFEIFTLKNAGRKYTNSIEAYIDHMISSIDNEEIKMTDHHSANDVHNLYNINSLHFKRKWRADARVFYDNQNLEITPDKNLEYQARYEYLKKIDTLNSFIDMPEKLRHYLGIKAALDFSTSEPILRDPSLLRIHRFDSNLDPNLCEFLDKMYENIHNHGYTEYRTVQMYTRIVNDLSLFISNPTNKRINIEINFEGFSNSLREEQKLLEKFMDNFTEMDKLVPIKTNNKSYREGYANYVNYLYNLYENPQYPMPKIQNSESVKRTEGKSQRREQNILNLNTFYNIQMSTHMSEGSYSAMREAMRIPQSGIEIWGNDISESDIVVLSQIYPENIIPNTKSMGGRMVFENEKEIEVSNVYFNDKNFLSVKIQNSSFIPIPFGFKITGLNIYDLSGNIQSNAKYKILRAENGQYRIVLAQPFEQTLLYSVERDLIPPTTSEQSQTTPIDVLKLSPQLQEIISQIKVAKEREGEANVIKIFEKYMLKNHPRYSWHPVDYKDFEKVEINSAEDFLNYYSDKKKMFCAISAQYAALILNLSGVNSSIIHCAIPTRSFETISPNNKLGDFMKVGKRITDFLPQESTKTGKLFRSYARSMHALNLVNIDGRSVIKDFTPRSSIIKSIRMKYENLLDDLIRLKNHIVNRNINQVNHFERRGREQPRDNTTLTDKREVSFDTKITQEFPLSPNAVSLEERPTVKLSPSNEITQEFKLVAPDSNKLNAGNIVTEKLNGSKTVTEDENLPPSYLLIKKMLRSDIETYENEANSCPALQYLFSSLQNNYFSTDDMRLIALGLKNSKLIKNEQVIAKEFAKVVNIKFNKESIEKFKKFLYYENYYFFTSEGSISTIEFLGPTIVNNIEIILDAIDS